MSDELLDQAWELDPQVSIRPEPFGALAYHFGTRRLTFLKTPELAGVVRSLGDADDVRTALGVSGVPEARWATYAGALAALAGTGMIRRRDLASQ